jgi:hypothetical protein
MKKEKFANLERPQALSEKLKELQGATIHKLESAGLEKKGMELIRIDITDPEAWDGKKNMELLLSVFGEAVLQAFGPRESTKKFDLSKSEKNRKNRKEARESLNHESDFGDSDSIFVVADKGKLVSFLCGKEKELPDNQKGLMVNLVFTAPEHRNQHFCRGLYAKIFEGQKYEAIMACSTTPGAVKEQLYVGRQFGYDTFIAGNRDGNLEDRGTPEQQQLVEKISVAVQKFYFDAEATPPMEVMRQEFRDHLVINEENGPIPPLKKKDVNFDRLEDKKNNIHLGEVYEKILTDQKKTQDTIYSMIISLRNKA